MAITRLGPNQDITAAKIAGQINFKNLIINGDMSIAQRGTSTTNTSGAPYLTDRWRNQAVWGSTPPTASWTITQSTDVPTGQGFRSSLKYDNTTAQASLTSDTGYAIEQRMEGQMLQSIKKGTSNAEQLTLSFWIKSNKTGTYVVELYDQDNTRHCAKSYTIDSASTWEKKTITYPADTTGVLDNDNNTSIKMRMWIAAGTGFTSGTLASTWASYTAANAAVGQVNLADSTSNEIFLTGVQLEVDTSASDFEFLPYDVNLQRCERYCQTVSKRDSNENHICLGVQYNSATLYMSYEYRTVMRGVPSLTAFSGTSAYRFYRDNTYDQFNSFTIDSPNEYNCSFYNNGQISGTQGQAGFVRWDNTGSSSGNSIILDAEL